MVIPNVTIYIFRQSGTPAEFCKKKNYAFKNKFYSKTERIRINLIYEINLMSKYLFYICQQSKLVLKYRV